MSTSVSNSRSVLRTEPAASSSFKSRGATGLTSIPRLRSGGGAVSVTCVRASEQNLHTVLGVARGATRAEIKKAYRRLALQYHPDVCKGDHCSSRFQQITVAYEALMAVATSPPAESGDDSSDDLDGFVSLDEELWEEWMGWEGAGTLDFSDPSDRAN